MSGIRPRFHANLEALRVLRRVQAEQRPATPEEQTALARWSGWGAIANQAFKVEYAAQFGDEQAELRSLLDADAYDQAKRTTLSAYYTDAALVQPVWEAVQALGIAGGNVLEPGCGAGTFLGFAPAGVHMTGVELDSTTAAIAALLYPDAQVRAESFAHTTAPHGTFDAAVGNVPFGKLALHDPRHNADGHSIHNHFLIKSLDLVKEGGVVAMVTSHWTMDRADQAARAAIEARADVLGVVRLPSGAHQMAAGTNALTDVIVLRKRPSGQAPRHLGPITGGVRDIGEADPACEDAVHVNRYFDVHPEHVLGQTGWRMGQRGPQLEVRADAADLGQMLRERLGQIVERAREAGLSAVPAGPQTAPAQLADPDMVRYDGLLQVTDAGELTRIEEGIARPYTPTNSRAELVDLVRMRDTAKALLDAQQASAEDTEHIEQLRTELNQRYDTYRSTYGYLHRRTASGARYPQGGIRRDPWWGYVSALEKFDVDTGKGVKSNLFTRRVVHASAAVERAETPRDALLLSMSGEGEVDLDRVARLLGLESASGAQEALGDLVFYDPDRGKHVPEAEYLAGEVRLKLERAREAAVADPSLLRNVQALEQVQPPWLSASEIIPQLGAPWIPDAYVQQFFRELIGNDEVIVKYRGQGIWEVSDHGKSTHKATEIWGTGECPEHKGVVHQSAHELLHQALVQKQPEVTAPDENGRFVQEQEATSQARLRQEAMGREFTDWLWRDAERTAECERLYNHAFNSLRRRDYHRDVDLERVFPGLDTLTFAPRPHQIAATERFLSEGRALFAHPTGAGKTGEIIMAVMEARRLGKATKPLVVVPKNVLEHFATDFARLYPNSQVLASLEGKFTKAHSQEFLAQAAQGDWDAVLVTYEQLKNIPLSHEMTKLHIKEQLDQARREFEDVDTEDRSTVKQIEQALAALEEREAKHLLKDTKVGWTFDRCGFDGLFLDEIQRIKNITVISNIKGVSRTGAEIADHALMLHDYMRRAYGDNAVRVGASATPLANSAAEFWVWLRIYYPEYLERLGLTTFDQWAATFAMVYTATETGSVGDVREVERFRKFRNIPEMVQPWSVFADVLTKEDLGLPEPQQVWTDAQGVEHSGPRTVVMPPTLPQLEYIDDLIDRVEMIDAKNPRIMRYKRDETRALVPVLDHRGWVDLDAKVNAQDRRLMAGPSGVVSHRMADLQAAREEVEHFNALSTVEREKYMERYDQVRGAIATGQLVEEEAPGWFQALALGLTKTDWAAQEIYRIWLETKDNRYKDPVTKELHPRPGALQLVFGDVGVWSGSKGEDQFTVYDALRDRLVELGMPAEKIRFYQEAKDNERRKKELEEACRDGRVAVVIGGTSTLGTGVNVQDRAVHLLHLDCPWRPMDLEQREGRIIRQGNQNEKVRVTRQATPPEAGQWETVARKATMQRQVMRAGTTEREMEDFTPEEHSFSATAAEVATNPRRVALSKAEEQLTSLQRNHALWANSQARARTSLAHAPETAQWYRQGVDHLEQALERRTDTRGKHFTARIGQSRYTVRKEAGAAIKAAVIRTGLIDRAAQEQNEDPHTAEIGRLGGFTLAVRVRHRGFGDVSITLVLPDLPAWHGHGDEGTAVVGYESQIHLESTDPVQMCRRLEDAVRGLDKKHAEARVALEDHQKEIRQMEEGLGQPFSHQTELENLFSEVTRLRAELGMSAPTFQVEEATHRQTPLADAPSAPARAPQPRSTPTTTTSSPGGGTEPSSDVPDPQSATEPPTAAVTPTPTPGTAPSPSRSEAAEAPVETQERSPELFLERARTTIAAAYGDAQAQRRARTQLRSLFIYARDGEMDARQVLELFADYYAIDKRNAPALERLRAQLAFPTADSPGFADALIVHVHRDRILVQANAPLPDSLSEALAELGFTTNDHVFWNLDGVTTSAQHRARLGELLHTLDVLVDAPERMPVEHRDAVLAGPPETAPDPLERSALTGADADLYDQVEDLIERGMFTQAWEKVDVRLQQLRLDQHLTDEEITDTTAGRLHERVLGQSRRRERSLDAERLNMGTLNEAQRQEFEDRYAAGCPHLSSENIRERVQASAEATEALKGASRALAALEHALPNEITARQQVLQTQIRAVAATASPEQAVSLISAANKVDPGGVLAREALRHELVLPNAQAPGFTRALLFSLDVDQPRVHLSRHTPDAARQVLATHGWIFTGSPLDPELSLTGAPEDNHDALHATLADLDALPEPPVRGLLDRWTEAAYPHHNQEAQDAITALNGAATETGERAQALIGQGQERAAAQLALDHIERAREAGVLHGSATKVANGAYLDAIGASMTQADELHTHGQTLPEEDVRGRWELARAYWERCPHLGREQIAERTGHTVEQLRFESEPFPASRVNEASAPVAEPAQSPFQQAQASLELLESTVHSTPEMRTELKKALEALDPTEAGHDDINALFVRANRADSDGIWERERLRSALLYPVEGQGQGTPMCALTPYADEENFESLLPQGQLTPRGLLDKLKGLGFYTPRLVRHGGIQALQTGWRYETRRQRINEVIAYCDEHGISVITQEQHELRRDAQRRAQEQQSDREHQRLVERTPAVRYAVETRVNMGRLREAVALIDAHLTELGLMGRLWQGLDKAKQHELWPLREEVLAQGRERAQPIHQALEALDPDDVQEELRLLNQLELEAAHLPLNNLQNRIAAAEVRLAQETAANRADAAPQQPSLLRGQIDHTPPDLSVQGTQGRADAEKVRQLATSRRTRDQGQATGESHAALVDEIHQSVIERLTTQNWAGAWRLLVGARFADFQAVAALNPEDVLHPHHDTLVEMAWALTAEDALTTGDAHLALAQAEQALAMNGGTGAPRAVAEAVDKLTDCGLWRHADLVLHHAQQQGLDVAEARDQLRQDAATEFFEANSGTLLRKMGMQVQPQLFDRARLRIRPSRVQERETKDSTHRSLSSAPSRNLTSVLYEMWGDGHEDAALAVINEANRADPRMAWHREELRSRILFTDTNAYGKTALVRIEHTRAETRVHGAGGLSTDSPLGAALRQATFVERKSGYWSPNHNASHSVRTVRVGQLIHLLDQHGITHVDESRWQALLHDSDGTRRTDEDLRERLVGARSRAYELWDQGQYREALQVLVAYVRETAADLSPVDREQEFGVGDLGSDIHTEATALEGQARQRYQKAREDGARPSELLQLLEDFERSALEPAQIPDLPRLRRRLHAKMMEGDVPLRSQEHAAPDPSLTEDVTQAEASETAPLVGQEAVDESEGRLSDSASAVVPGEEATAERLAARWAMRQRRSANSIERGLGPRGDFMSGPRRALMVQALWALGGPLQSRFGGGARYALELGEQKFLGKVTREEEQWAYDYTRTHPDFTRERTWEEIESVTQAALRYNDPATALRMIDNYDGRSTNSLAIQMREQIIAECTEQVKSATGDASWAIGHLDPEGAWAALQRSRPHAEALQDISPADEARPGMLWKAARKVVLAARELSHQDTTPQTPTAVPSWRTEDRQVGSGRQAPVIITPGGHVLGMVANQRQAERVLLQTVNLPSTPALPVKDDLAEALEVYRDVPSWHHAQHLGQLTVKAAGQGLIDMALRTHTTATEHAPHEQQGWWNSNRSQVRAASGRALFTDITASTEDASTANTPAQEDNPTKSQTSEPEASADGPVDPEVATPTTQAEPELSTETQTPTEATTPTQEESAEPIPTEASSADDPQRRLDLAQASLDRGDYVTGVPREDSSVPIVNGPPPGGWTDADRITPRTEPEFALEPGTDPGERAAAAIEGIGSSHRFTKEASTFWDGLDQALTDLSAQGRHQEVVDAISRVREQNHHDWWRWETHRSRAVAALNPDIIDRALLLHYARTDNDKAETHLYGVTKSDKDLHRLLKRSPFNFNHKVTENRWQVDPRWGWDKHEPRLRALIRHFDEQGIAYLSQQVHDELVEQRSKATQTEPKAAPVTAPQTRQDTSEPGENPPRSAPTTGTEEQITVTADGHVGEIHGVLKAAKARVKVLSEFTHRSGPRAGEPGWRAVYDLGGGREVMQWHTERPDITQGQTLTDFVAKVRRHTWYNPGRGRPRQAQTEVVVAPPRGKVFPLTAEQEKIVEHAVAGDLMVVQAGAGTGKTSTSTRIAEALTEQGRRGIYTVYGRANADEAIVKLAHVPVQADTLHAIARAAVGGPYSQRLGSKAPRPDPLASMRELQVGGLDLAGGTYLGPKTLYRILDKALREFEKSADLHISADHIHLPGYNPTDTAAVRAHLAPVLDRAWADIADPNGHLFKFAHDSYVKIFHLTGGRIEVGGQGRGFVIIDEAQDMNKVAEAILRAQPHLQLIWVGDSAQAIHGWRGAIDALERQQPDVTLSLSKSFRFGPQVAEHANRYLEALDAPLRLEGNPALDSVVQDESVADPDMILCRTNAGVFTEATYQLDQGRTVGIIGGTQDLSNLVKAAEELRTEGYTEHPDLSHFASWKQVVEVARDSPEDLEQLAPFVRVIDTRGASEVRDYLARMSDTDPDVWLSTAHRSKGLEENVVQIGGDFKAKTTTESEVSEAEIAAELRLKYVAVTRAKTALGLGSLADDPDLSVAAAPTGPHAESSVREPTPASGPDQGEAQTTPKPDTAHTDAVAEPQSEEQTPKVSAQPKQTPTAQQAEHAEDAPTDGSGKAIEGPSARDESNPEPTEASRPTRDLLIDVGAESIMSIPLEGEIKETNYIAELRQIARDLPEELRLALTPQDPKGPRGGVDWSQTPTEHLDTLQERGLAMTGPSGERYLTQRGYNVSRLLTRMLTGPDTALLTPTSGQKSSDPKEAFDHEWVPRVDLHGELEPGPGLERVRELAASLRPKHLRAMDRWFAEGGPNRKSLDWDSTPDKHMRELRDLEIVFRERGRWWFTHLGESVHDLLWRHKYGPEKGLPIIERSSSAAAPVSAQQPADEEPQPTLFAAEPEPRTTPVTPAEDHDEPAPTQTPTAGEDSQEEPKMSETPEQKGPPSPEPDIRQILQSLENQDELWSQVRQEDGSWVYAIGAPGPNQQRYTAEELRQHFLTSNQTHETSPQAEDEHLRQALQEATGQTWNTFYDNGPEARYSTGADPDQSEWLTAEQARAHLQEITSTSTSPTAEEPATEQAPAQAENEQASVSATDLYDDLADLPENDAAGAEQGPAPHDPPADASQENETPPPPETEPDPELGPDMDHALGEANFGRGPLAQEQPRLEVQLGDDPENEPDQDQKQKNLHIALGESHTDTGTNTSSGQESNDAYGPGQGSVEALPQAARQEQPHTIDGRDLRMKHGWHKSLDKSDYVTAASEVDPHVYQDMRKKLSKALDSGNDVKLVLPSNDPDQVRAFIDMAKERGYQVTLSARIDPNAQRAIDGAQAITDHLVNGSVHHAIPSEYARKEQRRLQQILTECDQDKLVDRIDLYPRNGADPAVSKRLIGDRTPEGQLTGATWNMRSSIAEEINQLRSTELSPQEAQRIRQQMHSIYEQLPGEEKLRSAGEVRARTEVVDALNYLASDQGLAPLDPDSARNVDISGHDPLVDHHGGPEKASEEHPPPPEEPPYPEKEHTAPGREPAMAGAGPTSPPTREEALAAAHTPDSGAVRRPPSSPKPTPTAPGNGPVTHSRVRGPRP